MPRGRYWHPSAAALFAVLGTAFALACGGGDVPAIVTPAGVTATSTPRAPVVAAPTTAAEPDVQAVLDEVRTAHETAQRVLEALGRASKEGSWAPVSSACEAYPNGAPQFGSALPMSEGLHTRSKYPALWPSQYVSIDSVAATSCFVAAAARQIPPAARIDPGEPTTAQIIAQPLAAALDEAGEASPQELRILIEQQR